MQRHRRRNYASSVRYAWALFWQFRWTMAALAFAWAVGTFLYALTPHSQFTGDTPLLFQSAHATWMALLAQPVGQPENWYLAVLTGLYPLLGVILIGEGVIRFAFLLMSKREGEKEWMRVMAVAESGHVVLCGIGHLGFRVLEQLVASQVPVVVIEKDGGGRFVSQAKALGVAVLLMDMKDDQSLVEANVAKARVIVVATNDDMANLEVALDARRMNPKIRVIMRLFDQQIASKISGAFMVDSAFSSSALAAPMVAAMSLDSKILASFVVGGVPHVTVEVPVETGGTLIGKRISELEQTYKARVLARTPKGGQSQSPPPLDGVVTAGDVLVIYTASARLAKLSADGILAK